ncbi:hyaluronan synthase 1 [Alligator mississippiensis]|uniref:Hyaluronan synthase 1 n=1 Tax=Alligator mississippiensis TaxID=8496 RepID=A0A151NR95_ALLMI|nr:hyaluronan synthase 1 [Alligator mississippiensis]KYO39318.1 hypothetical protein Y1Q_0003694 [Alligator mississippiensis]
MDAAKVPKLAASAWRRVLTVAFALLVLGVLAWAYVTGLQLAADRYHVMAFGLYGVLLAAHLVTQSAFACREHRRMRAGAGAVCSYTRTVALTISAYQEDPAYLRQCLESVRALHYPPDKLRIIMVIDGNSPDDRYMLDMFAEVFAGEDVGTYVWEGNYHHPAGTKMAEGGSLSAGETLSAYTTTAGGEGLNTMETKMAEGRGPVGMEAPLTYTSMVEGEGPVATETPRGYTKMVEGRDRITMETPFTYSSEVEDERPVTTEMATGSTKMMDGVGRIAMEMAYTETGPGTPSAYTKVEMRAGPVAMERPSACTKMAAGGGPVTVEMPSADAEELGGGPPAAYAEVEMEDPGRLVVEELVRTQRCVCIMQRWGGKREVMYTAFRALGDAVDYVQVCDSDTKLDPAATVELVKVLESNERYGAVGGDVRILNASDSFISFMSSLRYWMAFNIERACQSYFDCVSCISGPLGLYRNNLLQQFLESWYNQKFLGTHCTFGDDRHLTNRMLSIGYATKYTARSRCYSETPAGFLRWLTQQTRWTKSYFREWLYNALWWHRHHPWMAYEAVVAGAFPFFVTATVLRLFYGGSLWDVLWVLLCVQLVAVLKALYAASLRGHPVMLLMSVYAVLYMGGLLPAKYLAMATMNQSAWGTSGRRRMVGNYLPLLPLGIWGLLLLGGLLYTAAAEARSDWSGEAKQAEKAYLVVGAGVYIAYWALMAGLYWVWVRRACRKRAGGYRLQA